MTFCFIATLAAFHFHAVPCTTAVQFHADSEASIAVLLFTFLYLMLTERNLISTGVKHKLTLVVPCLTSNGVRS